VGCFISLVGGGSAFFVMLLTSIPLDSRHCEFLFCMCIGWLALADDSLNILKSIFRIHSGRTLSSRSRSSITRSLKAIPVGRLQFAVKILGHS